MNYELTIHEGSIISCQGEPVDITIPAEVVRIAESAFKDKSTLKSVKFEGTAIKAIEAEAFCGCNSLLGVVLPVGTVHIGARAFKDCKELRYVSIPSTVMVIDEDAFSGTRRDFVILGVEGKESEKYAKEHKHIFKPSTKTLLMQLKAAEKERAKVETRVFEVLGQKITCSNTLGMYHEALVYYADRKDDFYEKYIGKLPMSYGSQVKVDLLPIIETEWNATVKRLETHGVSATENTLSLNSTKYLTAFSTLCDISKKIADAFVTVRNEVYEAVSSNNSQLIQEAENSITGLSYGIIGDGLDMLAYSLDNYSAKKRQRKEAYAEAQKKADAFGLKASSAAEKAYAEFIKNALPKLRACTDNYIDALCDAEIQTLIYAGLIEGGIEKDLDIQKSSELVASLSGASGDDTYTIGLALKKYPHNIAAHVYAAEHNYKDAGLDALTAFLGLDATIKKILQQKEQQRYDDCLNHLKHVATENAATLVGALQHNQIPLRDADLTAVLKLASQNIQLQLNEKIENTPFLKEESISEYCHDALVRIISAGDCGYLIDKGMILPKDYSSYADIEPYLIRKVTEKIAALEQERIAEEKRLQAEAEQRAEEARKQAEIKRKNKVTATITLSIACAAIVFCVVLVKVIIPNNKYNDAVALMDTGNYAEAIAAFEALGDYKDSTTQIENCKIGIKDNDYDSAITLMADGKYEKAITAFEALNGYKDSAEQIENCQIAILDRDYAVAVDLMRDGKYEKAITAFEALNGYKGSAEQIAICQTEIKEAKYTDAVALLNAGNHEEAYNVFATIREYKDTRNILENFVAVYGKKEEHILEYSTHYKEKIPYLFTTQYEFDDFGNCIKETSDGETTTYAYDNNGNCIKKSETSRDGYAGPTTIYQYNDKGNCIKETLTYRDGDKAVTTYEYDSNGNCVKQTWKSDGWDESVITYKYDSNGLCIKKIHQDDNDEILYTYNSKGDCTKEEYWDYGYSLDRIVTYKYDSDGNCTEEEFINKKGTNSYVTTYEYDSRGLLIKEEKDYQGGNETVIEYSEYKIFYRPELNQ